MFYFLKFHFFFNPKKRQGYNCSFGNIASLLLPLPSVARVLSSLHKSQSIASLIDVVTLQHTATFPSLPSHSPIFSPAIHFDPPSSSVAVKLSPLQPAQAIRSLYAPKLSSQFSLLQIDYSLNFGFLKISWSGTLTLAPGPTRLVVHLFQNIYP